MGEAILVVRQVPIKTPDPTITIQTQNFESLVVRFTNTHDEEVVIYYEVDEPNDPDANQVTVAADSFEDRTITGLNSNTSYTVYAYALESGQRKSDVVGQSTSTQTYTTQTPDIDITSTDVDEVTALITNNDTSEVTVYYGLDDNNLNLTTTIDGSTSKSETITGLSEDTDYTFYAKAQASNENLSALQSEPFRTDVDAIDATGGSVGTYNIGGTNYKVHAFTNVGSSNFTVNNSPSNSKIDVLIVAGGGGGGSRHGGGGGAGGVIFEQNLPISNTSHTITVGDGGNGAPSSSSVAPTSSNRGDNTVGFGLTAVGGGAGSNYSTSFDSDQNGGSGGGSRGNSTNSGGNGTSGQGNDGGNGVTQTTANFGIGGGGGGAGAVGLTGNESPRGRGGDGIDLSAYFPNWGTNSSNGTSGTRGWFGGGGGAGGVGGNDESTTGSGPYEPGLHLYRSISNGSSVEYFTLSSSFGTSESKVGDYSDAGETVTVTFDYTGTKFYTIRRGDNKIKQYNLSTPYDIVNGSVSFVNDFTLSYSEPRFMGMTFDGTGTKLFVSQGEDSGATPYLSEYSLSTPWEINTTSFVRRVALSGYNSEGMGAVAFNNTGTRMYVGTRQGSYRNHVYQYDLQGPFDITNTSNYTRVSGFTDDPAFVQLSLNGNYLYIWHHSPNQLERWDLTTPFDVTTKTNRVEMLNNFNSDGLFISGQPQYANSGTAEVVERTVAVGGAGGGGNGGLGADIGEPGMSNTGGGGGAGGHGSANYTGKKGGSGIVLIRYEI